MTSLCNITHFEDQITDGLVRQGTGSLFPYNPEFYERASGLYGPGSIICWYLLFSSLLCNWDFDHTDPDGIQRPRISGDVFAVLAYPVFAATDLFRQALGLRDTEHAALGVFCLRWPEALLDSEDGIFNHTQLNLSDIPPDVLDLGQRAVDYTGPLPVCYTLSMTVIIFYSMSFAHKNFQVPTGIKWILAATWIYVSTMIVVSMLCLGVGKVRHKISLASGEIMVALLMILLLWLVSTFLFSLTSFFLNKGQIRRCLCKECVTMEAAFVIEHPGTRFFGVHAFLHILIFGGIAFRSRLRPASDLGIGITEKDQLAALIGGILVLCWTIITIPSHYQRAAKDRRERAVTRFRGHYEHAVQDGRAESGDMS